MNILAVTACPLGMASTYMAAEGLERAAREFGFDIKVETQGFMGVENEITDTDIKKGDVVILTKDMPIKNTDRFKELPIKYVSIYDTIRKSNQIIKEIIEDND